MINSSSQPELSPVDASVRRAARVLAFSTLGSGSSEEARILELLSEFAPTVFPFDRRRKVQSFWKLCRVIHKLSPDLVVMEGTGLAGGAAIILSRKLWGRRYVVSSGDAVGPWVASQYRLLGPLFGMYERILCRMASGFIGWTPYLAGRALTFGIPRAMTAAGWAPFTRTSDERKRDRLTVRQSLGIPPEAIVVGIAGSLVWSSRYRYCYGMELVKAAHLCRREDVYWLVVGDGNGLERLKVAAANVTYGKVIFTDRLPQNELPAYYAAMDIGSLPQSTDKLGSFRYTTKLSEYLAFQLPIVTGEVPLAYDLNQNWFWRLPGKAPWDARYVDALARLVDQVTIDEIHDKRDNIPERLDTFDRHRQVSRATSFIEDLVASLDGIQTTRPC
jgi:glycosyltransferase involved in cell wall biosynthesis